MIFLVEFKINKGKCVYSKMEDWGLSKGRPPSYGAIIIPIYTLTLPPRVFSKYETIVSWKNDGSWQLGGRDLK